MYEKYTRLLKEKGTNTKAFCDAMDVPQSTMSMWKKRVEEWDGIVKKPTPSFETVAKMAKFFDVPIEYFLEE